MTMDRCKEKVFTGRGGNHQCARKAVLDGFCKQHHPEAVKARRTASEDRWRAQSKARDAAWARTRSEDERRGKALRLLRVALDHASHGVGCRFVRTAQMEPCDCWKAKAWELYE